MYLYCWAARMFHFKKTISFRLQLVGLTLVCKQSVIFEFLNNNTKWDVEM